MSGLSDVDVVQRLKVLRSKAEFEILLYTRIGQRARSLLSHAGLLSPVEMREAKNALVDSGERLRKLHKEIAHYDSAMALFVAGTGFNGDPR